MDSNSSKNKMQGLALEALEKENTSVDHILFSILKAKYSMIKNLQRKLYFVNYVITH